MLPSNVDPRRADRIVRQKPTMNANGQGEDLTPDYMNILGQRATTANATAETASSDRHMVDGNIGSSGIGGQSANESNNLNQTYNSVGEDIDSTTNVIPTSPQYGVAIIPNQAPIITSVPTTATIVSDITTETVTLSTDTITDTQVKQVTEDGKDIHSTPSRNDRFKVVKIASLEPFKRGRWKCMDYVDEAPPPAALQQQQQPTPSQQQQQQQQQQNKVTQSSGNIPVAGGGIYLQTQSLPQQQIQQMLLQSGYTNGTQFYQNVPTQMMPQTQYFYPAGTNLQTTQTLPQQLINTTGVPTSSIPTQFINTNQPYFTNVPPNSVGYPIPTNYQNLQYVPANMMQPNQNSAFVPTSQTNVQLPTNFQQNQTYAGQPNVNQQPMVNGHAYPTEQQQQPPPSQQPQQQQNTTSLPAQTAKNIILNSIQQPVVNQPPISQPNIQTNPIPVVQTSAQPQTVPVIQPQQQSQNQLFQQQQQPPPPQQQQTNFQQVPQQQQQQQQQQVISATSQSVATPQTYEQQTQSSNVYTNPQFDMSVNSLTILENSETSVDTVNSNNTNNNNNNNTNEANTVDAVENTDDPSKTNPVVNAIDNKIEQAMDLVKSHLMYTVREEVEVLKEKIAELMERIQQLETENNFLRSQIPKSQTIPPSINSGNGGGGGGAIQQTTPTTVNQPAPPPQTQQPPSSSSTSSAPTNLPTETNPPPQ